MFAMNQQLHEVFLERTVRLTTSGGEIKHTDEVLSLSERYQCIKFMEEEVIACGQIDYHTFNVVSPGNQCREGLAAYG